MDIKLPARRVLLVIIALFFSLESMAQLPAFTITATPTHQTCLGNGAIALTPTGTQPGATVDYAIYLLPNTTTPVVITTTPNAAGLVAGNYLVVATQSLVGESNTATANVTINNNVVPLAYTLVPTMVRCGNDGVITINVTNGVGALYEILSGPVTLAPQPSNVLNGLPPGNYQVRVYDNCGEANVVAIQLIQLNTGLSISSATIAGGALPACNLIGVSHNVQVTGPNLEVFYPLTCVYTVYPPGGGAPIVVTNQIASGSVNGVSIGAQIPFYHGQQYTYNLKVTDACGNVYNRNNVIVNRSLTVAVEQEVANCGDNAFIITPSFFVGPVTISFTTAPAGFDPVAFNAAHPNFSLVPVAYGDSETNPVPQGQYAFVITDACGHSATGSFEAALAEATPQVNGEVQDCSQEGSVMITIPGREVVTVVVTEAPDNYPGTLDDDVSEFITEGQFFMDGLPIGAYTVVITDSCGEEYEHEFLLAPTASSLSVSQHPGCEEGKGSVRITSNGTNIANIQIIAAPIGFVGNLPLNVNQNIAVNGRFYMNSLPEGDYIFRVADNCGGTSDLPVTIEGYHILLHDVDLTPTCSTFHLEMHHSSNGDNLQTFYLQRYNEIAGVWEHPITGVDYTEGSTPNTNTSYLLNNNATNINIQATGQFRIIKLFYTWANGSASNFRCLEVIDEFFFDGAPVITDAYSFPCAGGLTQVIIVAEGVPPLTYRITTKNGEPFVVDNGTSNLFSGLEPATYNFQVGDDCGNLRNIQFDINALDPIALTATGFCEGEASSLSVPEFSFLTYEWWEESAPGTILSTSGTLNFPAFNSVTQAGTYYVSISSPQVGSCIDQAVLTYEVQPNTIPQAGADNSVELCNTGQALNLANYLTPPHDAGGTWNDVDTTGALAGSLFNAGGIPAGTYRFAYIVDGGCGADDEAIITIELKDTPLAVITVATQVCVGSPLQLSATAVPSATYQWAGPNNFTSVQQNPLIASAAMANAGMYSLIVTVNGCTSAAATANVVVNMMPLAGADNSLSVCNDAQTLNLDGYLSSPHDAGGIWEDTDSSGGLTGNTFNTIGMADGTYHFTYKVTNSCGQDAALVTIELKQMPNAPVIAPVAPVCEGNPIQLSATAVAGATYQWTGPNNFTSTQQNPLIANAASTHAGTYSLTVTLNGCASPASTISVVVTALPFAGADNSLSVCNDGQAIALEGYLSTPHDGGGVWEDTDNSGVLAGNVFNTAGVIGGIYRFTYRVSNSCGQDTAVVTIELKQRPLAPLIAPVSAVCEGGTVQLSVAPVAGATYQWTGPVNFASAEQNPVITPAQIANSGTYSLITTVNGCASPPSTVNVTVNERPVFTIGGTPSFCEGQSTVLSVDPGNFTVNDAAYAWYHDGELLTGINESAIEVFEPGVYDVEVNRNGCTSANSIAVTYATGMFAVELEAGCENTEYVISIINIDAIDGANFEWTGPNGYHHVGEQAIITNLAAGEYFVEVTNAEGCSENASIEVGNTACFIPRGISPNNDGYNYAFDLSNLGVKHIKIFNRYGLEVYEKHNYIDEWHGQSHRGELPTGTYYYVLTLSAGKKVTGWVYLQREIK